MTRSSRIATKDSYSFVRFVSFVAAAPFLSGWVLVGTHVAMSPPPVTFTDVTKAAGIDFTSYSSADKKYIVERVGGMGPLKMRPRGNVDRLR